MATEDVIARYKLDIADLQAKVKVIETELGKTSVAAKKAGDDGSAAMKKVGDAANPVTKAFEDLGKKLLAAFAVERIIAFGISSVKAFQAAEISAKKLQVAVGVNGGLQSDFENLIRQSADLQKQSIFSDEAIQGVQTMALQFGLSSDAVSKLTPQIIDFASATGQDLNSALTAVLQGINGMGRGLKVYGVEVSTSSTRSERFASIMDQLNSKFEGQGKIIGETSAGRLAQLANAWDDLKESIGGAIAPLVAGAAELARSLIALTEVPLSQKLQDEKTALETTTVELLGLNVGSERRIEIIKQLQQQYPDYLGNIDAEKVSNEELNIALSGVNNSLIVKIALQKQDEEITDQQEKTGNALAAQYQARQKALADLNTVLKIGGGVNEDYNKKQLAGLPLELQIHELLNGGIKLRGVSSTSLANLGGAYNDLISAEKNYSVEQDKTDQLVKKRIQSEKELTATFGIRKKESATTPKTGLEGETEAEREKRLAKEKADAAERIKREKEVADAIAKINEENFKLAEDNRQKFVAGEIEALSKRKLSESELAKESERITEQSLQLQLQNFKDYGKDTGDIEKQIADNHLKTTIALSKPVEIHPNREDFDKIEKEQKDANDKIKAEHEKTQQQIRDISFQIGREILDGLFSLGKIESEFRQQQISDQLDIQTTAIDKEIAKLEERNARGIISESSFASQKKRLEDQKVKDELVAQAKINAIKHQQDLSSQRQALANIAINTAETVLRTTAQVGFVAGGFLVPLIIALGAAQAAIVLATPLPKYFRGTEYLRRGNNPTGRDTIPFMGHEGEAIIPSEQNKKHPGLAKAWITNDLDRYLLKNYISPALKQQKEIHDKRIIINNQIDQPALARLIARELRQIEYEKRGDTTQRVYVVNGKKEDFDKRTR